jgi:hypothetical protein
MPTLAVGMLKKRENRNMPTASVGMAPKLSATETEQASVSEATGKENCHERAI